MAKKQITLYIDDLTGEELDDISTIQFAVDGSSFEIDLTAANAQKLREALAPYVTAGRKVGGRRRGSVSVPTSDASKVREWAVQEGIPVPTRGRIPQGVVDQYRAAH